MIIGVDPHKITIEVVDHSEQLLGGGRFATDKAGYADEQRDVRQWPDRVWAAEGASGAGRPLARRLVAVRTTGLRPVVGDGELGRSGC